jgi:hypothetical protein
MNYYNEVRTHLSLGKDAPTSRRVHRAGHILCRPVLGGLHQAAVRWTQHSEETQMDTTTLLIIVLLILLLGGGGWYGRGRWY